MTDDQIDKRLYQLAQDQRSLIRERDKLLDDTMFEYDEATRRKINELNSVYDWPMLRDETAIELAMRMCEIYDEYRDRLQIIQREENDLMDELGYRDVF